MKIMIDTKNDKHEIKHLLNMLKAILEDNHSANFNSSGNIFDSSSPSLNMYDSSSNSSSSSTTSSLFSLFDQPSTSSVSATEQKDDKKDFIDQLQLY